MSSPVIEVDSLWKKYRLGVLGTGTLSHDLNRWWHRVRGKPDPYAKIGEEQKTEITNRKTPKVMTNFSFPNFLFLLCPIQLCPLPNLSFLLSALISRSATTKCGR